MKKLLLSAAFILVGVLSQEAYSKTEYLCVPFEKTCTRDPKCKVIEDTYHICRKVSPEAPIRCLCNI